MALKCRINVRPEKKHQRLQCTKVHFLKIYNYFPNEVHSLRIYLVEMILHHRGHVLYVYFVLILTSVIENSLPEHFVFNCKCHRSWGAALPLNLEFLFHCSSITYRYVCSYIRSRHMLVCRDAYMYHVYILTHTALSML